MKIKALPLLINLLSDLTKNYIEKRKRALAPTVNRLENRHNIGQPNDGMAAYNLTDNS